MVNSIVMENNGSAFDSITTVQPSKSLLGVSLITFFKCIGGSAVES